MRPCDTRWINRTADPTTQPDRLMISWSEECTLMLGSAPALWDSGVGVLQQRESDSAGLATKQSCHACM